MFIYLSSLFFSYLCAMVRMFVSMCYGTCVRSGTFICLVRSSVVYMLWCLCSSLRVMVRVLMFIYLFSRFFCCLCAMVRMFVSACYGTYVHLFVYLVLLSTCHGSYVRAYALWCVCSCSLFAKIGLLLFTCYLLIFMSTCYGAHDLVSSFPSLIAPDGYVD